MESWNNSNYYTTNFTEMVVLMNLSTAEWGIGALPSNLVAIPGAVTDPENSNIPDSALVIEYAAQAELGSRDAEKVVFGVTSGIVILWGLVWLWFNRRKMFDPHGRSGSSSIGPGSGSLLPRSRSPASRGKQSAATSVTALVTLGGSGGPGGGGENAADFQRQLLHFYYEPVVTELEVREPDVTTDGAGSDDVEDAAALVRKMLALDMELWSHGNVPSFSDRQRDELRTRSDAVLAELRRIITGWDYQSTYLGWRQEELRELKSIVEILDVQIPGNRYYNGQGQAQAQAQGQAPGQAPGRWQFQGQRQTNGVYDYVGNGGQ